MMNRMTRVQYGMYQVDDSNVFLKAYNGLFSVVKDAEILYAGSNPQAAKTIALEAADND